MLFHFFISIVFIAELIITFAIIINLVKFDKKVIEYNSFIDSLKPSIKDLMVTVRKISEQFVELAPICEKKIKSAIVNMFIGQLKNGLGALTFWLVKKEVEKHV